MSTSGSSARCSLATQGERSRRAGQRAADADVGEPQPQLVVWLMPTSRQTSQPESRNAPSQLTRPGTLIGDSGTKNTVAIVATTTSTSGSQNSQW